MRANKNDRETQTSSSRFVVRVNHPVCLKAGKQGFFTWFSSQKTTNLWPWVLGKWWSTDQPLDGMNLSIHFPRFSGPMVPTQPFCEKTRWLFPREEAVKRMKEAAMYRTWIHQLMVLWTLRMNNRGLVSNSSQRDITWNCGLWNSTGGVYGGLVWTTERGLTSRMFFDAQQSGWSDLLYERLHHLQTLLDHQNCRDRWAEILCGSVKHHIFTQVRLQMPE